MTSPDERETALEEVAHFLSGFRSAVLATASDQGEPDASYAPFVMLGDGAFWIYVSRLARHTVNLLTRPRASVLMLEDERAASEIFARRRLSFTCRAERVDRDSERWPDVMAALERKFGDTVAMIRPLQDFELFRLAPESARYVRGFAQAYEFRGARLAGFSRLDDRGDGS